MKPEGLVLVGLPQLTKAQILLAKNDEASILAARQLLDDLLVVADQYHVVRRKIEILALYALVLDAMGETPLALEFLEQAVELSQPGKSVRVFVDLGGRMRQMLDALTIDSLYATYIQKILLAFPTEGLNGHNSNHKANPALPILSRPPSAGVPELVETLTMREMQVLTLLREPLSAKEIALQLHISYATEKRHSINLYSKLGVNSRWDAVAMAENLGLLPPRS
jgi:LuxR family transcriptional regulator, maltose regulon positive regulatory protein